MSIYANIYYNLCESNKKHINEYTSGSGLHKHHIIPKHCGGSEDFSNFTYLTVREHIIAHFLLWKMFNDVNDLRAMKMLGANLTTIQRQKIGKWCRDNKIGIHGSTIEERKLWQQRGMETQKTMFNSWYYWSTPEGRKKRASMGGKIGGKKQHLQKIGIFNPDIQKYNASLGGKSHIGKVWINKDGKNTRILKTELSKYVEDGWTRGINKKTTK